MAGGVKGQSGTGTMVRKYIFGEPIETDAVVKEIASSAWSDGVFLKKEDGFHYILCIRADASPAAAPTASWPKQSG